MAFHSVSVDLKGFIGLQRGSDGFRTVNEKSTVNSEGFREVSWRFSRF